MLGNLSICILNIYNKQAGSSSGFAMFSLKLSRSRDLIYKWSLNS